MRTRVIIPILLLAGFILLLAAWFRPQSAPPAASVPASATTLSTASNPVAPVATALPKTPLPIPPAMVTVVAATAPDEPELDDRIGHLEALAHNRDADSFNEIMTALKDANPQIRSTAVEAAVQFGSPNAIPPLQAALAKTEIPQEKQDLQQAIDFLKLPSFSQNLANSASPSPF